MNKLLPHFINSQTKAWLIDTDSTHNYNYPELVPTGIEWLYENFEIITPTRRGEGTEFVFATLKNAFRINFIIKLYVYKFSETYDILLGYKTLQDLNMAINF